ncbi:hypothetical protein [Acinetobacter indicus]|uniref:hypothetical protein n=1 Tax=Acinetobacter indicus TaxID=756892 RepID=UPI00209B9F61|nr:hypothetical protein [Acinetobacter indicus]MCO8088242.1 hypothetical protein [Acinetobacter indicus]
MITKFLPAVENLKVTAAAMRATLAERGVTDEMGTVIANIKRNAEMLAAQGVDAWLSYGVYLPAVERVIALHSGESEEDFLARTQYPVNVVDAYSVKEDDFLTLVAADEYSQFHKRIMPKNTAVWCLDEDEQHYINLLEYENRLKP